jgi:uncharacterized protein (TIGR00106 family)
MTSGPGPRAKVIGDISIYPVGEGTSLGDYVNGALRAMRRVPGVRLVPTAMSTIVEADGIDDLLRVVKEAHTAMVEMGAKRIAVQLRVDHRLDKSETIEYKLRRVSG